MSQIVAKYTTESNGKTNATSTDSNPVNNNCSKTTEMNSQNDYAAHQTRFFVHKVDYAGNDAPPRKSQLGFDEYLTREAPPRVDHYRNIMSIHGRVSRPTLEELHVGRISDSIKNPNQIIPSQSLLKDTAVKFGWIQGVLIRCLLNIWGVMLFLRLSWVIGQAGIGLGSLIILLATSVTAITTISMCAICTNGEVKGGGTYYMISRSLGPEFGGSIGIIFALANAVAVAMYTVGFAEALQSLFEIFSFSIIDGDLMDRRIISCITICFLLGIAIIGTEWETKAQIVLLIILLVAMADYLIGALISPDQEKQSKGFVGWNATLIGENFMPDFRGETFFSVFAVFFPAATGMLAGANISGDLKDPQYSIPLGSLLAIVISTISYLVFGFIVGGVTLRDANGSTDFIFNNTEVTDSFVSLIQNCSIFHDNKCKYGLQNDYNVMQLISLFGPLIYAGIFAATLSSALASLVSAPKVFQALCKDKLFPYIEYFGRGFGPNNEPRRGYLLAFGISFCCCIIGELNLIAPIISNFFLAAYCLINFSCFHASMIKSPGFRPSFKYYNKWVSLLGSLLSLSVMFTGHWSAALLTFILVLGLYLFILHRKPDVNWGSSTQAQTYLSALNAVHKLNFVPDHVKNYRPQILVLSGYPFDRPPLIDFAYSIVKKVGLLICGHVQYIRLSQRAKDKLQQEAYMWMRMRKVKGFYNIVEESQFSKGVNMMVQSTGMGKLKPNMVLMGFKDNWLLSNEEEIIDYFTAIHIIFDKNLALGILRLPNGLDYSRYGKITEIIDCMNENRKTSLGLINKSFVVTDLSRSEIDITNVSEASSSSIPSTPATPRLRQQSIQPNSDFPRAILESVNQFKRKQNKGCIDVWWLYDDGGLTLLIPYLLTTRKQWKGCKLRLFALVTNHQEMDKEERNMAALLSKFRIDYSMVTMIDLHKSPREENVRAFHDMISKWLINDISDSNNNSGALKNRIGISETEILALREKTNRHIRLRELLCQHSKDATLIVMTLSLPRKGTCTAFMYMAWLETLTNDMPPFLLIRGNQTDVLTYYS